MNLANYQTLVFDCDGVVLNSNRVKTEAFRSVAAAYGVAAADALVDYHVSNGGVSRYHKFAWFREQILPATTPHAALPSLDSLLAAFSQEVQVELQACELASGLEALRLATADARWLIVSGGDQDELRSVFRLRDIARLFDGGIFGSPDDKSTILFRELANGNLRRPALFLGDSRLDHQVAAQYGLDFVFVHEWTELPDWQGYCAANQLQCIPNLAALLAHSDSGS